MKKNKNLVIIANGPSVNDSLNDIVKHKNCDFACMNYFPIKCDLFDKIKPSFLFTMDVMFFDLNYKDEEKRKNAIEMKKKLKDIDWEMIIFTRKDMSFLVSNSNIREIRLNTNQFSGVYSKFRGKLFDLDMAVPANCTVAVYAILCGVKMNYENVYVYGIDNSAHLGVKVNEKNQSIVSYNHFYKENREKERIENDIQDTFYSLYMNNVGYRMLRKYAEERNVNIYNCTKNSFVDAFLRRDV